MFFTIMHLNDTKARLDALDITNSCIIQAPAGSGKTELLTQRFLSLLSRVKQPEEIIAITFTRKAASEMHERIVQALHQAQITELPAAPHAQLSRQLAQAVLHRDQQQQWQLLQNPTRLRVTTIDSLCHRLTAAMPLLSKGTPYAAITDNSQQLYQLAAKNCLQDALCLPNYQSAITTVLLHLGNHQQRFVELMAAMLGRREQWLPYVLQAHGNDDHFRQILETGLSNIIKDAIFELQALFEPALVQEILLLGKFAASNLIDGQQANSAIAYLTNDQLTPRQLWQAIAELLLTQQHQWRNQLTKQQGFPAKSSTKDKAQAQLFESMKQRMEQVLEQVRDHEAHRLALQNFRVCPDPNYTAQQWQVIQALITILPMLAGQLKLVFAQHGQVDFIEIAQQATAALGELDEPSDLALHLDHKIQHLLVDEFQDTSVQQFKLLEKLTAGWQNGDGRTLFIVGDPMQSIYRFREAEVGLFLRAKIHGIGAISLKSLQLSSNFRSSATLVTWVNNSFKAIFPAHDDLNLGAISYHQAIAMQDANPDSQLNFYACEDNNHQAAMIIELIKTIQAKYSSDHTIALLVRSRSQLSSLLPMLRAAKISFQGVEIDNLSARPVIQDLWSLTQALLHPADRLAWLSILRAPWCGLKLNELLAIAQVSHTKPIISILAQANTIAMLDANALTRIQHLYNITNHALQQRGCVSLSKWIAQTWRQLGGELCVEHAELADIAKYWELLDAHERNGLTVDMNELQQQINRLFSHSESDSTLQIMTIHKAKGLEFDTVILPALDASTASNDSVVLQWLERTNTQATNDLILAPLKANDASEDAVYQYLTYLNNQKNSFELQRLLYVAVTRAKTNVHFFANTIDDTTIKKNSLLKLLAPHLPTAITTPSQLATALPSNIDNHQLTRLPDDYFTQQTNHQDSQLSHLTNHQITIADDNNTRLIGTFIHEQLKIFCENKLSHPQQLNHTNWHNRLLQLGITHEQLQWATDLTEQALINFVNDPRGRWISTPHPQAHNEYKLTYYDQGNTKHYIIDRTFVDASTNQRWIIDYKTTTTTIQQLPAEYKQQLEHYATLLHHIHQCPIYLGLYYPLTGGWFEWQMWSN